MGEFLRFGLLTATSTFALSLSAQAGNFLGHSTPGIPGFAVQMWPSYTYSPDGTNNASNFFQLAWFSETGITGTKRDQFELWTGFAGGWAETPEGSSDDEWGASGMQFGGEYYYQMIQPTAEPQSEGYRNWWISPTLIINTPNGNSKGSGYGAGMNQWSVSVNVNNYFAYDKWHLTISPVSAFYAFENINSTTFADGSKKNLKGGLSLTFADAAFGYSVTKDLMVGVHHQYDIYNVSDSDYARSERGALGPTFTYTGLASKGYFMAATVDFDYYNRNTARSTKLSTWFAKAF